MQAIHQRPYVPSRLAVSASDRQSSEGVHKALLGGGGAGVVATKHACLPWALFLLTLTSLLIYFSKFQTPCLTTDNSSPPIKLSSQSSSPLAFMRGRSVLLVSHELSVSGGPLLLMELSKLLTDVGAKVQWVTNRNDGSDVTLSLEDKLRDQNVQILVGREENVVQAALRADLIVLNTAVAGKWIDTTVKDKLDLILPKVLWWIHEMRGHYFSPDLIKHLPRVAGAMIDSHATAEYWKNRTTTQLRLTMPKTYVVHLGNSKDLTAAAENELGRRLLREHVREHYGVRKDDVVFSIINSFSRGKGQDAFLKAFVAGLKLIDEMAHKHHSSGQMHAFLVGSSWAASRKYEKELVDYVKDNNVEHLVHFVNTTLNVVPYLAATDVLVQNSQKPGECFGRITIEAMAFGLPVLGTAAGGTKEIVVDKETGFLHPVGRAGIPILAENMAALFFEPELRALLGDRGLGRANEQFTEHHMSERIASVLQEIVSQNQHSPDPL